VNLDKLVCEVRELVLSQPRPEPPEPATAGGCGQVLRKDSAAGHSQPGPFGAVLANEIVLCLDVRLALVVVEVPKELKFPQEKPHIERGAKWAFSPTRFGGIGRRVR
jgi:hypothetical protein